MSATARKPPDFHVAASINLHPLEALSGSSISFSDGNIPGCFTRFVSAFTVGAVGQEPFYSADVADFCHVVKTRIGLPIYKVGIEATVQQEVCDGRTVFEATVQTGKSSRNFHTSFSDQLHAGDNVGILSQSAPPETHCSNLECLIQ